MMGRSVSIVFVYVLCALGTGAMGNAQEDEDLVRRVKAEVRDSAFYKECESSCTCLLYTSPSPRDS